MRDCRPEQVDEDHFLNFVAQQLQGDPAEELRECWKITSGQTKTQACCRPSSQGLRKKG